MISELARSGSTLSEMRTPYEPYVASGEINTVVDDPSAVIDRVRARIRIAISMSSTGLPSARASGGSTSAPRIPNRYFD